MEFRRHPDRDGLDIYDPIETVRFALFTPTPVRPETTSADSFYFPIDAAVTVETTALEVPKLAPVTIRTQSGAMVVETSDGADRSLDGDSYLVELSTAPMKLYLAVEGSLAIEHDESSVVVRFDGEREVGVGARSLRDSPAGTITVTDDPEDVMAAVSLFGSALQTTSPERSFQTLRGHPPLVERGESFDAPDDMNSPETGIELVLPPERKYIYPAVSLAYYHGAALVPGGEPRLVASDFEHSLDGPDGYEATVNRTLRQSFFLDCLTRTEGFYQVDLYEREQVEPLVALDFADLYDAPLAERLGAYFDVPFETIEPSVPTWRVGVDIRPTASEIEYLPHLVDELALIRTPTGYDDEEVTPMPEEQVEFFRSTSTPTSQEALVRGTADRPLADEEIFNPPAFPNVLEQAWVGDGIPFEVNKLDLSALRRRFDREPSSDTIDIHVVCNDSQMMDEDVVGDFYGLRELLTYDVTVHYDLVRDELAEVFADESDFLHYIGHVDEQGFLCADGYLDAHELNAVGTTAFLLNACQSYEQGRALIRRGSQGGVVTLWDVGNSKATWMGTQLARLLNCGFNLRSALSVVQDYQPTVYQYVTLGDGGLTLVQSDSGFAIQLDVERVDTDSFAVTANAHLSRAVDLGSLLGLQWKDSDQVHLSAQPITTVEMTSKQLNDCLNHETMPVDVDGVLVWSDTLSASDI